MRLPANWEIFLKDAMDFSVFYSELNTLLQKSDFITPQPELIFNVFHLVNPRDVRCVLFGEDPYPRRSSANGVAFWDAEIKSWQDKTNGNSLKNILKALLTADGLADYHTPIARCREIALERQLKSPQELFQLWLSQGVLLINTSLTFAGPSFKKEHFLFWQPFHRAVIAALNTRKESPFYILWGKKAQAWEETILQTIDNPDKIIKQGHPTFIHQFLKKETPEYSPFTAIRRKTGFKWL